MFNTIVFDIVIGLIFIYLLYSLLATLVQEIISANFALRAKILERGIIRMLEDGDNFRFRIMGLISLFRKNSSGKREETLSTKFYEHPLIKFLGEDKVHSMPAYIKKTTFSKVIIDLLRGENVKPGDDIQPLIQQAFDDKKTGMGNVAIDPQTLRFLKSIWVDASGDIEKFKQLIEDWFDETMERVSGWYKKYIQVVLLFIGLVIAIIFDVDTIAIVEKLEKDPKLREQIVQQADAFIEAHPNLDQELQRAKAENALLVKNLADTGTDSDSLREALDTESKLAYEKLKNRSDSLFNAATNLVKEDLGKANNLLGNQIWSYQWKGFVPFLQSLFGWFLTALAISLGAPFWFDMLNKLMKLRSSSASASGKKSTKKTAEG